MRITQPYLARVDKYPIRLVVRTEVVLVDEKQVAGPRVEQPSDPMRSIVVPYEIEATDEELAESFAGDMNGD